MFSSLGGGRGRYRRPRLALVLSLLLLLISPSILSGEVRCDSNSSLKARHTVPSPFSSSCQRYFSPTTPDDEVTSWLSTSFWVRFPISTIFMALSPCETEGHGPLQITGGRFVKLRLSSSSRDRSCTLLSDHVSYCSHERFLKDLSFTAGNNGWGPFPDEFISPFLGILCRRSLPIRVWICCCLCATFLLVIYNTTTLSVMLYPADFGVFRTTSMFSRGEHLTADDVRTLKNLAAASYDFKTLADVLGLRPIRSYIKGSLSQYSGYFLLLDGLGFNDPHVFLNPYKPYMGCFIFFIVIFSISIVGVSKRRMKTDHLKTPKL